MPLEEVYRDYQTSEDGLSDAEAAKRLKEYGKNELRQSPPKSVGKMFFEQLTDVMVLILLGAALLSGLLNEWIEAIVILTIVIVNAIIGVVQEKKASDALAALRSLSSPQARVLRNGEESIVPASELVPGDIVYLEDGSIVPADMRLIDSSNLKIQEASLTGESVPVEKDAEILTSIDAPLGDRLNMAYTSSIVMYGNGTGVVVETGMHTEVGQIAGALDTQDETAADDSCFIGHFYHPRRAAGHRHHCHGAGRTTHGKAPSTGAQAASRGDPGQRFRHLLR